MNSASMRSSTSGSVTGVGSERSSIWASILADAGRSSRARQRDTATKTEQVVLSTNRATLSLVIHNPSTGEVSHMRRLLLGLALAMPVVWAAPAVAQDTPLDQISAWSKVLETSDLQSALTALADNRGTDTRNRVHTAIALDKAGLLAIHPDPCWQDSYLDHWEALALLDAAVTLEELGELSASVVLFTLHGARAAAYGDTTRLDDCFQ